MHRPTTQSAPMSIDPIQPPFFAVAAPGTTAGLRATAGKAFADALSEPFNDAMAAVQTAMRAYERLRATGRELRFEPTDAGLRIEVYDGEGRLLQRIPPNEALALAAGDARWQA
jgi:hypothetical protein